MVESCGRSAWWRRDKGSFGNARQGKSLLAGRYHHLFHHLSASTVKTCHISDQALTNSRLVMKRDSSCRLKPKKEYITINPGNENSNLSGRPSRFQWLRTGKNSIPVVVPGCPSSRLD